MTRQRRFFSISPQSTPSRRAFLVRCGAGFAALALASSAGAASACTIVEKGCGTIVVTRSGSDVVVTVKNDSGAAQNGARVSVRKGRGAFDVQQTGRLGQTIHELDVVSGDIVDVVVDLGDCRISAPDCVLP